MLNCHYSRDLILAMFDSIPLGSTFKFYRQCGREWAIATKINTSKVSFVSGDGYSDWTSTWEFKSAIERDVFTLGYDVDFSQSVEGYPDMTQGIAVENKIKLLDYKFKNKTLRKVNVTPLPLGA